jgi:hypothetical protein
MSGLPTPRYINMAAVTLFANRWTSRRMQWQNCCYYELAVFIFFTEINIRLFISAPE